MFAYIYLASIIYESFANKKTHYMRIGLLVIILIVYGKGLYHVTKH